VEDKVNQVRTDLGKRIDQTNTKLDQVRTELKEEIGGLRSEMNTRLSEQTDLLRQIAHNTKRN
jgi:chromosome segregation ATPase